VKRVWLFSLVIVLILGLVGCGSGTASKQESKADFKVGLIGPLSGQLATYGVSNSHGAEAAVEVVNAAGGVNGRKFKLVTRDDANDPTKAVTMARELLNNEKVEALLVAQSSTAYSAIQKVVVDSKLPTFLVIPTTTELINPAKYPNVFRDMINNKDQVPAMVNLAVKNNWKKIAVVYDTGVVGKAGLVDTKAEMQKVGLTPVVEVSYGVGDSDMTPTLLKVKAASPDVVVLWGAGADAANIAIGMKKLGLDIPIIGRTGMMLKPFEKLAGDALQEGKVYSIWHTRGQWHTEIPSVKKMNEQIEKMFGGMESYEENGYNAVLVLADAMKRAGNTDPAKVVEALEQTKDFEGSFKMNFSKESHESFRTEDIIVMPYTKDPNAKGIGEKGYGVFTDQK